MLRKITDDLSRSRNSALCAMVRDMRIPLILLLSWLLPVTGCTVEESAQMDAGPAIADTAPTADPDASTWTPADLLIEDLATPSRCPQHMILIPGSSGAFCIDQYESSTMRILPTGGEEPWPFDRPVDGQTVRAVIRPGQKPQAYISAVQASDACKRSGKRLCTETEWLSACQGTAKNTYPYGTTYQKGACNEGRATNPVNDCFGSGSGVFTYANMNSPCCVNQPSTLAVGGSFPQCKSDYGVFDLHGNLHEWIDATSASGNGVFKGGFFVDAKLNGSGCLYKTTAHAKSYHDYSTGFRCCASASP